MELNSLYNIAEKENIKIYDWQIEDVDGIYLNYQNINAIALNYDRLGTYIDEKCTLAEELGHYYMDATYPASTNDTVLISKQEYRAKKWSYFTLVPLKLLKDKISNGLNIYELSEYFEVSIKYMNDCLNFYIGKYGPIVAA